MTQSRHTRSTTLPRALIGLLALLVPGGCGSPAHDAPPGGGPDAGIPDAGAADAAPDAPPLGDPFAALQAMPPICSADHWCWRTPAPTGNDYDRVFATAPDNVWLIGQHGTVLQWTGHAWIAHQPVAPAGQPAAQFSFAISGRGPTDMWLIYGNTVQHWDGMAWTIRDSLPPSGVISFDSIWAAPGGEVWVTVSNGTLHHARGTGVFETVTGCASCFLGSIWGDADDDFFITTLPAGILHYDGKAFTPSYSGPLIAGSYAGRRNDVWVAGADGALLHWDGTAWTPSPTGLDGWTLTTVGAPASNDVSWWASRSSATSQILHWDGAAVTATALDTSAIGALLFAGAIVDGRWWLVGEGGAVYTRGGDGALQAVVAPASAGLQSMWGAADDDLYFASGGQIQHWNGKATSVIPVAAGKVSGVQTGGVDELFATGFDVTADGTGYIASAYHFDGTAWTQAQLVKSTIADHHYFAQVFAMGPGEAMAVGYGGIAYHFTGGAWQPIASGVTSDLLGVWGPDADHLWIVGAAGTLLTWDRANPDAFAPDATLPTTTSDLVAIHGAGGITWIATGGSQVLRSAPTGWTQVSVGIGAAAVFAIDATNAVFASAGQSQIARWNGDGFVVEDSASGVATPVLFRPPGGPMLAGWLQGVVEHP